MPMPKSRYRTLFTSFYDSLLIAVALFSLVSMKHFVEFGDGLWFQGECLYGFPVPYIWKGLPSMSINVVVSHLILDFSVYLLFSWILTALFQRHLRGKNANFSKGSIRAVRILLLLFAAIIIVFVVIFVGSELYFTWSHDFYNDVITRKAVHIGFYPYRFF